MMKEQMNQTIEITQPSQSEGTTSDQATDHDLELKERPVMPADLFKAVMEGNRDVLEQRLGLAEEDPNNYKVQIDEEEASDPAPQQAVAKEQTLASELQSATRFGCTILHLLVANKQHNDLAVKVFEKDRTLLTAQNKELETPLHSAARFGNVEVIQSLFDWAPDLVKNVLRKTNDNGDTALHVAAIYGQKEAVRQLMGIDPKMAYEFNKEGLSPLHIAIANANDNYSDYYSFMDILDQYHLDIEEMLIAAASSKDGLLVDDKFDDDKIDGVVQIMLDVDPTLAYTQFADGTLPIHLAARMGKAEIVARFISNKWARASLLDRDGRNLFHIAAANNKKEVIWRACRALFYLDRGLDGFEGFERIKELMNAKDCRGNTPLHIAAMMGNKDVVLSLRHIPNEPHLNNKGRTPFQSSAADRLETSTPRQRDKMHDYIRRHGEVFTKEWFDTAKELTPQEIAERTQVIGLGSVLITTIAFAAAFTFPGGYNGDNGKPILGRRYMFRAFMVANALAFVQSFASIFLLIKNYFWSHDYFSDPEGLIESAALLFLSAATSMVKAFGIGSYVMLAPVNLPIAIIILILGMLFGSSTVISLFGPLPKYLSVWLSRDYDYPYYGTLFTFLVLLPVSLAISAIQHSWPFLIIFGVAFLK